jgi:RNA polymerase sigma-70 factor (ECF subfamily)
VSALDSSATDGVLIAAALAGDENAFALLVARYQGPLHKAAISRLGRRELAEEAVQEAFLCAHRWLRTYDSQFSFRTWLWTILLNQCSRQAKCEARNFLGRAVSPAPAESIDEPCRRQRPPLEQLLTRETNQEIQSLLARLPEVQADALRLRFFGGLTFPEIAAAMSCSEPGAKNRVKSGLLKLAEWLGNGNQTGRNLVPAGGVDSHHGDDRIERAE